MYSMYSATSFNINFKLQTKPSKSEIGEVSRREQQQSKANQASDKKKKSRDIEDKKGKQSVCRVGNT